MSAKYHMLFVNVYTLLYPHLRSVLAQFLFVIGMSQFDCQPLHFTYRLRASFSHACDSAAKQYNLLTSQRAVKPCGWKCTCTPGGWKVLAAQTCAIFYGLFESHFYHVAADELTSPNGGKFH